MILIAFPLISVGQDMGGEHTTSHGDSVSVHSISEWFSSGHMHGRMRNYSMSTINMWSLKDYHTHAIGGIFEYHTANLKGFELGISAVFTFRLFGSDLSIEDTIAGRLPRYELQLYDVQHPDNVSDLDRIDELFLAYKHKGFGIQTGRFGVNTPHLNPMINSRMKPYSFQGAWAWYTKDDLFNVQLGFIQGISPRSTTEWMPLRESIGIYSQGLNANGQENDYCEHTHTSGIAVFGLMYHPVAEHRFEGWSYMIDNVSHSMCGRYQFDIPLEKVFLHAGLEWMGQHKLGNGGSDHEAHRYYDQDGLKQLYGAKFEVGLGKHTIRSAYLYSDANGRLLFPREMGREHFFATLSRGRMEGLGNSHLLTSGWKFQPLHHWKVSADISRAWTPDHTEYALNKYGIHDYFQLNVDVHYLFEKFLKGLDLRFLYVWKHSCDDFTMLADNFYKVNYHHFNLVADIHF